MRTLLVLLFACIVARADLSVGFAEADVTPKLDPAKPVYMAGFGHNRKATKVHDPIMARAVVLSDGKQKIALVCVDVVGLFNCGRRVGPQAGRRVRLRLRVEHAQPRGAGHARPVGQEPVQSAASTRRT